MNTHIQPPAAEVWRNAPAVIFDFNGTLSDDENLLETVYNDALIELGHTGLADGEYVTLLGLSEPDIARTLMAERGATPVEDAARELLASVGTIYLRHCETEPRIPTEAVDFVRALKAAGKAVAIVTGTLRPLIEPALDQRGLTESIDRLYTIEDVTHGKPDPEGFLAAARALGFEKADAILVLEDSTAGIEAATRAGMIPIAIGEASGYETGYPTIIDAAKHAIAALAE